MSPATAFDAAAMLVDLDEGPSNPTTTTAARRSLVLAAPPTGRRSADGERRPPSSSSTSKRPLSLQRRGGSVSYTRKPLECVTAPAPLSAGLPASRPGPLREGASYGVENGNAALAGPSRARAPTEAAAPTTPTARKVDRHQELLTLIAVKDRKCLDLREELSQQEDELRRLKLEWQRLVAPAQPHPVHPPTPAVAQLGSPLMASSIALASTPRRRREGVPIRSSPTDLASPAARVAPAPSTRDSHVGLVDGHAAKSWMMEGLGNLLEMWQDKPPSPRRHMRTASQPVRSVAVEAPSRPSVTLTSKDNTDWLDSVAEEEEDDDDDDGCATIRRASPAGDGPVGPTASRTARSGSLASSAGSSSESGHRSWFARSSDGSSTEGTSWEGDLALADDDRVPAPFNSAVAERAPAAAAAGRRHPSRAKAASPVQPPTTSRGVSAVPSGMDAFEGWGGILSKRYAEALTTSKRATLAFVEGLEKSIADVLPAVPAQPHHHHHQTSVVADRRPVGPSSTPSATMSVPEGGHQVRQASSRDSLRPSSDFWGLA